MTELDPLRRRLLERGVLDDAEVRDGVVRGRVHLDAAGVEVEVEVDPETDDDEDAPELDELVDAVERVLAIGEQRWRELVDEIVEEIEDAVGDEQVEETTSLEDDLVLRSITVYADASLLSFAAPRQFPDARLLAQLDPDLGFEGVEVGDDDADD